MPSRSGPSQAGGQEHRATRDSPQALGAPSAPGITPVPLPSYLNGRLMRSQLRLQPLVLLPEVLNACQVTAVVLRADQQLLLPAGQGGLRSATDPDLLLTQQPLLA